MVDKLQEEIDELRRAMAVQCSAEIEDEMGDVLFTCVNLARHLGLDAEASLRRASGKFERRFHIMELLADSADTPLAELNEAQLDALWERAKQAHLRQK